MRDAGFSPELTYHAYHALDSHILGFTLWQLGHAAGVTALSGDRDIADFVAAFVPKLREAGLPHLAEHAEQHAAPPAGDGASEFEFGPDLILEGFDRARQAG